MLRDRYATVTRPYPDKNDKNVKNDKKEKKEAFEEWFERAWTAFGKYGVKRESKKYAKAYSEEDLKSIEEAIPLYLSCVEAGRTKSQFEGWLNPKKRKWDVNWKHCLGMLCDKQTGDPDLEEWSKARSAVASAIWDAKENGDNIKRVISVCRDKYRDTPRYEGGDAVTSGVDWAMNSRERPCGQAIGGRVSDA